MIALKSQSTKVPGVDEQPMIVNPGDVWPLPYRGSRYSVKQIEKKLSFCWSREDVVHCAERGPDGLIKAMIEHKKDSRGSIRITPHGEVITKRENEDGTYTTIFLGLLDGTFVFPGFDLDPIDAERGSLWPGLHFKHGEEFAVWVRDGNEDYLYWTYNGLYFRSTERYPELCAAYREMRPRCGRLYITEFGHVWINLPGSEISQEWAPRFRDLLDVEIEKLKESKNDILLQSLVNRLRATGNCYPVYLGRITDFDSGTPPRTHFSSKAKFASGGEDTDNDEEFTAAPWKKMTRDNHW